jgi:hypothetical protein
VTWTNGGGIHDVVFDDGVRYPPGAASGDAWTYSRTFDTARTYSYHCSLHQALGMTGTVTVNPSGAPPPSAPPPPPPPPPPPDDRVSTTVTLRVSTSTPARSARVRFSGSVRPARDGRVLQLQRRARGGPFRTVARVRLVDAGSRSSRFATRLRVRGDAVYRARLPADGGHEAGISRSRRLDVR